PTGPPPNRGGSDSTPATCREIKCPRGGGTPGGRQYLTRGTAMSKLQPSPHPDNPDAAYDATAAAELSAKYPGIARLSDQSLITIIADGPFVLPGEDPD